MASVIQAHDWRRVFTRAAQLLSESTSHVATLEKTLAACLPELGDCGFFDSRDADQVVRVAQAYEDEAVESILRPTRWMRQERGDLNLCALSTGQPALHPDTNDEWYRKVATSAAHLEILRRLAFRSMITVPMRHRGELIGALTLFMGRSGRRHDKEHLALALDVAGLASPVVANAQLMERNARAERALRASEERLRVSVRAACIGVWEWTLEDDVVYWSPEYREIYGLPEDGAPTFTAGMSVVLPQDRDAVQLAMKDALEHGGEFRTEHRITHPTKGLRWIQSIGRPVVDAAGRAVRVTGIVMDITEKQTTHRELQALRDRLSEELDAMRRLQKISARVIRHDDRIESLLEEILDVALAITGRDRGAIQLVDAERGILRLAAQRGFQPAFVQRIAQVHRDDPLPSARAWRQGQRLVIDDIAGDPGVDAPLRELMLAEGIQAVQSTPLVSRDGRIIGMFTTHSGTPHGRPERELRLLDLLSREAADLVERAQAEALLRDADRRKDEFLAILAHELRNPLAPIRYAVSIAREPSSTREQRRRAETVIERQVSHMGRLLDDLLDISRIARGTVEMKREWISVESVLSAAVEAARPLVDARGHSLSTELGGELMVYADPVRITQIVTNLLTNAAKYTDAGGRIELAARREGDGLVISVKDTGMGIAPEMRPRLFTLFSQADGVLNRSEGGLGIGLALVKGFVELHGGTVEVRSDGHGRGSEFLVRLPGVKAVEPRDARQSAPEPAAPSALRILIADDNRDICETCATLVELWGHEPHVAADGMEALDLVDKVRPDIALIDIGMPGMNGYEVARRIRQSPHGKDVVLIAVTGWGQEEAKAQAAVAGFDHHLTKPIDTAQLARILGAL